ncbi:MAG TPA: HAMP domain-containing sensor histidine kinase [Myxococcales bacterium]|jgi:signal transduction histidine kinase
MTRAPQASAVTAPRNLLATLEQLLDIQATDERTALTQASDIIQRALGSDKVDVFVYEPSNDTLVAKGTSETPMGKKQHELGLDRLPISNGGRSVIVYTTGELHLCNQADQDAQELRGLVDGLGVRSRLAVPLHTDSVRRGTLEVCAAAPNSFDEDDLRFLVAAARWIGSIMHRLELTETMRKRAVEQGRRKAAEDILTVLAHDLRDILGSATGRLAMVRERALRERREMDVRDSKILDSALKRLLQMSNNLLDVSRLERGLFSLDVRMVDLVELAREAVATLRRTGTRIEERYPQSAMVNGDPDRLSRALENLVSNAIKHSPPEGVVRIDIETVGEDCKLRVTDEGPGIPSEILPRIFERYVAGEGSHGLGIGLYLAHGIAVAHGGSLTVKSGGPGTLFELTLPSLE